MPIANIFNEIDKDTIIHRAPLQKNPCVPPLAANRLPKM
jgi:hypothetical protein